MLNKYHGDGDYIIKWDSIMFDRDLQFKEEHVAILDRDVRKLRSKEIKSIKFQWKHRPVEEATWETEKDMQDKYPSYSMTCLSWMHVFSSTPHASFPNLPITHPRVIN
ncbi:hypothetical protein MTR67_031691 [Solanum verrucosum]|uniref:Chromo domain-containing protein n=1 Tax=Solanum verrucosum TaxID=315347 RepID=A0AAF0U324_SOLVR|nr:hypothetical protein MTR67_031691 [Solanum verrucosum]